MTISAKSVLASTTRSGERIDTLLLRYPRFIHSEFMTHRVFSRSASSSRAIPVDRLIADVENDPVFPSFWGKNKPGMQATEELSGRDLVDAKLEWKEGMKQAIKTARNLAALGAHKQIVNRVLEPYSHINVVVTSTEWNNFFDLRIHADAQPEIMELATCMADAMYNAPVNALLDGEWHLPFVTQDEINRYGLEDHSSVLRAVSAARCARTSYKTHDGRLSTIEEDLALAERLTKSVPFHASPFEHQATPFGAGHDKKDQRNFDGWVQNRAIMENKFYG